MVVKIPLDGGLITNADLEEVGTSCGILINCEFDKAGLIYKRKGRATAVSIAANINEIIRWISPEPVTYWILCATDGKVYRATSLASLTEIFDSSGTRVRVQNYGSMLRFALGTENEPKIYQSIDRDFFWSAEDGTDHFDIDTARPRDVLSAYLTSATIEVDSKFGEMKNTPYSGDTVTTYAKSTIATLVDTTYYYKYSLVFDGNQESPLSDIFADTGSSAALNVIPEIILTINAGSSLANWNQRVTHINIYRSTAPFSNYRKIFTAGTKSTSTELINVSSVVKSAVCYIKGGTYATNVFINAQLIIGGKPYSITQNTTDAFTLSTTPPGNGDLSFNLSNKLSDPYGFQLASSNEYRGKSSIPVAGVDIGYFIATSDAAVFATADTAFSWDDENQMNYSYASSNRTTPHGAADSHWLRATGGGAYVQHNLTLTDTTTYVIAGFYGGLTLSENGVFRIQVVDSGATVNAISMLEGYGDENFTHWNYFQFEFTTGTVSSPYLRITLANNTDAVYLDSICIFKKHASFDTTSGLNAYTGDDMLYSANLNLGSGSRIGEPYLLNTTVANTASITAEYGWITASTDKAVQIADDEWKYKAGIRQYQWPTGVPFNAQGAGTGKVLMIGEGYTWKKDGNNQILTFYDTGLTDGALHPTEDLSLQSNFTYSVDLEGRQYVAGVKITSDEGSETHDDWVLFSELSKPDVIPISNYISIPDLQGGAITGLAKLIGDLVVFQSKGIYRISIPSADPTGWSLSESEPNIGCIAPDSIVEYEGGIFFAGADHLYYLDSNFKATAITNTIKSDYQAENHATTRCIVDVKKNRLMCKFGTANVSVYILDLNQFRQGKEHWSVTLSHAGGTPGKDIDLFTIDENLLIHSIESGGTSYLQAFDDSKNETTYMNRRTGWINIGNLEQSGVLRRLNLRYLSTAETIVVSIFGDGDVTTPLAAHTFPINTEADELARWKPNVRCRYFMVQILSSSSVNDIEIRSLEVEFE